MLHLWLKTCQLQGGDSRGGQGSHRSAYAWNAWREKSLTINPDLSGADLSGADFAESTIASAIFRSVDLSSLTGIGEDAAAGQKAGMVEIGLIAWSGSTVPTTEADLIRTREFDDRSSSL